MSRLGRPRLGPPIPEGAPPNPNRFRLAWGGAGGDWVFPPANLSEADHCQPQAGHQKEGIRKDALFLVHRYNPNPNQRLNPKRESPVRLPFRKGRRIQQMCSFRGSYANRGNGTELNSSDVVHRGNLYSNPYRRKAQRSGFATEKEKQGRRSMWRCLCRHMTLRPCFDVVREAGLEYPQGTRRSAPSPARPE